ncbi:uncharacterized protein LOC132728584 [Ruditapes philippinarum]|uniref:uncharacterized protein LOC132728584 n=1 Tax=Ruditapes philippinarum TaxID=129788 RepID=UPI00295BE117|nr:uncharacterized protein LOC132728584 [Ruditapes philippinarum]
METLSPWNSECRRRQPSSMKEELIFASYTIGYFHTVSSIWCLLQANEGGLSPGFHTEKYSKKCMNERKRRMERSSLPSSKRRRLTLKQERCICKGATEVLEGATYQSEIGLQNDVDVETIPDAVPRGDFKPLKTSKLDANICCIRLGDYRS